MLSNTSREDEKLRHAVKGSKCSTFMLPSQEEKGMLFTGTCMNDHMMLLVGVNELLRNQA